MTGRTIGRDAIESELGEGGMGLVFRARDTQLERTVAIKILSPDKIVDADRKRRFLQHARAASALNHPNIFTITTSGPTATQTSSRWSMSRGRRWTGASRHADWR